MPASAGLDIEGPARPGVGGCAVPVADVATGLAPGRTVPGRGRETEIVLEIERFSIRLARPAPASQGSQSVALRPGADDIPQGPHGVPPGYTQAGGAYGVPPKTCAELDRRANLYNAASGAKTIQSTTLELAL